MQIAIDGRNLISGEGSFEQYAMQMLIALAEDHPDHGFVFIVDKPWDLPSASLNVKSVFLAPGKWGALSRTWWEGIKLPRLLKTNGASVLIQFAESSLLRMRKPVLAVIPDVQLAGNKDFENVGNGNSRVVVFSATAEATFRQQHPRLTTTPVNPAAPPQFVPVDWEEKEVIKQQFANGFEYFLFYANGLNAKSELLNVLKAFSLFKLRQRTNMKLVIYGFGPEEPLEELNTYKFREGVRVVGVLGSEPRAKLIAGAYACLPGGNGTIIPVIEAMHCGVPVLTPQTEEVVELLGPAMIATPMNEPAEIAAQLKRIFLDEHLRSQLVDAAGERARSLNWQNLKTKMWEVISKAVLQ